MKNQSFERKGELKHQVLTRILATALDTELKDISDLLSLVPRIVLEVERFMKHVTGEEKKELVLDFLKQIINRFFVEDMKGEMLKFIETNGSRFIDTTVWLGNNSKVFTKKCLMC